jgi:hypothetical protein
MPLINPVFVLIVSAMCCNRKFNTLSDWNHNRDFEDSKALNGTARSWPRCQNSDLLGFKVKEGTTIYNSIGPSSKNLLLQELLQALWGIMYSFVHQQTRVYRN